MAQAIAARVIARGLIYSEKRGLVAFTVPQCERYLPRTIAEQ